MIMSRKLILLLLGLVLFLQAKADTVLAAETLIDLEKPVNVVWNQDDPYAFDENGIPSGFEIDLWRMIAETRQIPYRIKRSSTFKSMLEEVSSGEADLAIGGILINENRSKLFNFSFPTATSEFKKTIQLIPVGEGPFKFFILFCRRKFFCFSWD
jgi:ABC-type amino acid transport substrate-binding protein